MTEFSVSVPLAGTVLIEKPFNGFSKRATRACVAAWSNRFAWTQPKLFAKETMEFIENGWIIPLAIDPDANSFRFSLIPTEAGVDMMMDMIDKERLI